MASTPIDVVLIGAGSRGAHVYANYALRHPNQVRLVAVAEPDEGRRQRVAALHDLDDDCLFPSWEALIAAAPAARAAIVTTQDQYHVDPAVAAMRAGYDVLLEKPMAHTLEGCVTLARTAHETGRLLQICHVLRYSPFWRQLNRLLVDGAIGEIVTVEHRENVAFWHMAHSFVRGNWRNKALSSPMILAKCCHDLDILVWNLRQPVKRLSSTGSLFHFRPERAGPEIPARCTDGCPIEPACPFSAIGIYLDHRILPWTPADPAAPTGWPFDVISADNSYAARRAALETGPYGRCVYRCDNDVVDHQIVTMEMANGASVVLAMQGHSNEEHRSMRYDGTAGTLRAKAGDPTVIELLPHGGKPELIPIENGRGHGGGDDGLMADFVRVMRGEMAPITTADVALESHLLAFAAEEARTTGQWVEMEGFREKARING